MKKKIDKNKRNFLKWLGISFAAITFSSCKSPIIKSVPYSIQPELKDTSDCIYYATTMFDGYDISNVIVKTKYNKPIKIYPNLLSTRFNTTNSRVQASLFTLYSNNRLKYPFINKKKVTWEYLNNFVVEKLKSINDNKKIVIITPSLPSPSTIKIINKFIKILPNTERIVYDSISYSNILNTNMDIFKNRLILDYDLTNIKLLISFNSDFLLNWNMENIYSNKKKKNNIPFQHIQIESNMTITGANADIRISMSPYDIENLLINVYKNLINNDNNNKDSLLNSIIKKIKRYNKECLILADGNKISYYLSCIINKYINSNGIVKDKLLLHKESDDDKFLNFINDLKNNKVGAVIFYMVNPIYSYYNSDIINLLKNVKLTISCTNDINETTLLSKIWIPIHHWLETWYDFNLTTNMYTLSQPIVNPLFNSVSFQDILICWKDNIKYKKYFGITLKYYKYLRKFWENNIIYKSNVNNFNESLINGVIYTNNNKFNIYNNVNNDYIYKTNEYLNNYIKINKNNIKKNTFELNLYIKPSIGDGNQANNAWLQELPDPITKNTWCNYLLISSYDAYKMKLDNWYSNKGTILGNCVDLYYNDICVKNIPIFIQPGQAKRTIGLSFGYGRNGFISRKSDGINAYILYFNNNIIHRNIKIVKNNNIYEFPSTQVQKYFDEKYNNSYKNNIFSYLYSKYKNIKNLNSNNKLISNIYSLFNNTNNGHNFKMIIDLNLCIGCNYCVMSCNVENNIPVVGKNEIRNFRDMHWIRIDRYYENNNYFNNENPYILFQPVMCQHCNKAPCEPVCPVLATVHSNQGQNMMIYNRCIGTRYCANNCPYKVRKFNWYDYNNNVYNHYTKNKFFRLILNPDVLIRNKGVMEKCSLCIQITQSIILNAKKEKRNIIPGEFYTACSKICPTNAIYFDDINIDNNNVKNKIYNNNIYELLGFLDTKPNILYQKKIRNLN